MKVADIGEFALIDRLKNLSGEPAGGEVWIGDDTAVIRAPAGTLLFTTDLLIEGVHFDLEIIRARDLGYKAIAVNFSDVAAMGGTPRRVLVGAGIRPSIEVDWLEELYTGMLECANEFNAALVGGDISRSDCLVISVSLIGNPAGRRVIERRGARPGDAVCVTGTLGASAAGYRLLRAGIRDRPDLVRAHTRPSPRVKEAEALRKFLPTSMIDVSDGFAADLGHILDASVVGVIVDESRIPVFDSGDIELDRSGLDLALHGGEDYELCFTIAKERAEEAALAVEEATGTPVSVVGEIVEDPANRIIQGESGERRLEAKGWDHLRM